MEADEQLRRVIRAIWKDTDPLLLDQVVPPPDGERNANYKILQIRQKTPT